MPEGRRCRWCGRALPGSGSASASTGRPREFCRRSCRQRDYESRRRAKEHGLDEHEIIVARAALAELDDRLFILACALEDVERDLAEGDDPETVRAAVQALVEAAGPVVRTRRGTTGPD